MSVERDTQHGDSQQEGSVLALGSLVVISLVDSPNNSSYKQEDIDNLTRIERTTQHVDEEQFKPSAYLYDTWYDTIEHGSQYDYRDEQGNE